MVGMIARIALTGTIYRKIFNLSLETVGETTIGRIINLASSDVQRIDVVSFSLPLQHVHTYIQYYLELA